MYRLDKSVKNKGVLIDSIAWLLYHTNVWVYLAKAGESMAGMIPEDVIDDVRTSVDIADVVGRYVQLRKAGKNLFGVCPFHDEKTP